MNGKLSRLGGIVFAVLLAVGLFVPFGGVTKTYAADPVTQELTVTKVLNGDTLAADQFEFTIAAKTEGAPMPEKTTAKNDADGNVSFGNATYTTAGTYEYTVKETKGDDSTITYDEEEKTITVTVTENSSGGGGGFTPTVHVDESAAMQWLKSYAAEGEEVSYDKGDLLGGAATYKVITDGTDKFHPFCLVEEVSSGTDNGQDKKTRHKSNASVAAGGTYLDSVIQVQNTKKPGVAPSTDKAHKGLQMLFYAGYPYNQANLKGDMSDKEFYEVTQWALWGFMHSLTSGQDSTQRNSSGNKEVYDQLLDYANGGNGTNELWLPDSGVTMYIYWPAGSGSADDYQPMINAYISVDVASSTLEASATTAEFKNTKAAKISTTVTAGSKKATDSAEARLTYDEVQKAVKVVDAIDYEGLIKGEKYTVTGTLVEVDANGKILDDSVATANQSLEATDTKGTWSLDFGNVELKSYKKYVVFEEAYSDNDTNATKDKPLEHKDVNDKAQTILTENKNGNVLGDGEDPTPEEDPTVKTKVSKNKIDAAADQTFTDTVTLTNLTEGVEYTITGTLMSKDEQDEITSEYNCEPVTFTATAEEAAAETVEKTMDFTVDATDYAGQDLVVFETLSWTDDSGNEKSVEHADYNDADQTVTVNESTEPEPEPEPEPVKYGGKLSTTVSINNKSASATAARTLSAADAAKVKTVTDTIQYSDLQGGDTYTLTGKLVKVKGGKVEKTVSTAKKEVKADESGSGQWKLDFTDVTLEADSTYVVFEEAANTDANKKEDVVTHDDINDKAQTIIVEAAKETTTTKNTTAPKTGDTANTALWIAIMAAACAATGVIIVRKRRTER